ncbi:MAG: hypothetical protein Q8M22_20580 [Actinomycetota bacterium]|nr:hypothetical protein [Actinomycetota bacterium]
MADLILVALMLAFTATCLAYIAWCDRITGVAVFVDRAEPEEVAST